MVKINPKLFIDIVYPVGSYYETSNISFNPNTAWGGTWVEDSKGRVTVGMDTTQTEFDTIGETGGEKTHTLTIQEMPSHSHNSVGHTYGAFASGDKTMPTAYESNWGVNLYARDTGGGQSHNNLQPYVVVKRWHRTA